MAYGTLKCDNIVFDNGGVDKLLTVSGLFYSTSGALTVTGTISGGNVTAPTATFTTLTGTTTAGTTATFTSGSFTSLTGVTTTGTTANFVTHNGASGIFTSLVSGATITGTTANFTSGNFISLSGTTTTVTSGVFSAGSATAPSVAVGTGTSNSPGIYSPGTDQLAISTSGQGRVFVDSSGNIGINTSPSSLGSSVTTLEIKGVSTTRTGGLRLSSSDSSVKGAFYIYDGAGVLGTETSHPLGFYIANTERMRIDSSGNVGVGVTPSAWASTYKVLQFNNRGALTSATGGGTYLGNNWYNDGNNKYLGTDYAALYAQSSGQHIWYTAPSGTAGNTISFTQAMTLDASGRLGLGTNNPSYKLDVSGDFRNSGIYFNQNDTPQGTAGTITRHSVVGLTIRGVTASVFDWSIYSAAGNALISNATGTNNISFPGGNVVFTGGSVGIGDTGPTAKLVCNGHVQVTGNGVPSAGAGLEISYGQITAGRTSMQSYNRTGSAYLGADYDALDFRFYISGSEKCRIDSSGRLLVGTSTYQGNSLLQIQGDASAATAQGVLYLRRGLNTAAIGANVGADLGQIQFGANDGTISASIQSSSDATWSSTSSTPGRLVFSTTASGSASPSEAMRISSNRVITSTLAGTTNQPNIVLTVGGVGDPGNSTWVTPRIDFQGSSLASAGTTFIGATGALASRALIFATGPDGGGAEKMRIGANGVVTINNGGAATANQSFVQVTNGRSSQNVGYVSADTSGNEWHFGRSTADGYFYVVRQTGTGMYMNTNSWVATSDQRAKQDIADIESTIDVVKGLKPSRFNWKSDGTADVGFIAQQVQPLIPEAVVDSGNPDAMLGITQDKLLPFVVKALQEAIAKIETLEAKVTVLEGK